MTQAMTTRFFNLAALVFGVALFANSEAQAGPLSFSYEGRAYDSTGVNGLNANVTFTLRIYNPAGNCLIYEETTSSSDLGASNGYFAVSVGAGTPTGAFTGQTLASVFSNRATAINGTGGSCPYTPNTNDARLLEVVINPSGGSAITLSPRIAIGSSPYAMVADDASTLGGLSSGSFVKLDNVALTQTNVSNIFSSSNYPLLTTLLAGTNPSYVTASTGGAKIPTVVGAPASPAAGQMWFSSSANAFQYYNGSSVQTLGAAGSGVSSLTVGSSLTAGGTAGGTLTGPGTIDIANSGAVAGAYPKLTINSKGLVTYGTGLSEADIPTLSTAGRVSGNAITSGTIGGTTTFYSSGNVTASLITAGTNSTRQVQLFDPAAGSSHKITIAAPTLSADYTMTFPTTIGSSGFVLTTDGAGTLSWTQNNASGVTSSASLPSGKIWIGNSSNVASTVTPTGDLTLSIAGSGTVTGLRGAPLSATLPTASGQVLRWNGTSWTPSSIAMADLRSIVTGTSALTSCTASQTLVFNSVTDSLLCSTISIANSQVTWASTSANLVFAGPSTGGAAAPTFRNLVAADLPSGIGSQWTTTGSNIFYGSGSVGVGTVTPQAALDVYGVGSASALIVPRASIANRPVGVNGMIRYQLDNNTLEAYANGVWAPIVTAGSTTSQWTPSGTNIYYGSGNVGIGTTAPTASLQVNRSYDVTSGAIVGANTTISLSNNSSASSAQVYGVQAQTLYTPPTSSSAATITGVSGMAYNMSGGLIGNALGTVGTVNNNGGGTITTATGAMSGVTNTNGSIGAAYGKSIAMTNASSGTISSSYELFTSTANTGGGSITNQFGIYQSTPGSTNFFAGKVGIGTALPIAPLDVKGHIANSGFSAVMGSCGTSPSLSGNDMRGTITLGTGTVPSCAITFASSYPTIPYCVASWSGTTAPVALSTVASNTGLQINFPTSVTAGGMITYICIQ